MNISDRLLATASAVVVAALAVIAAGCAQSDGNIGARAGTAGDLPDRVDEVFADYSGDHGPGCSVGVIQDGRLIGSGGYGMANLDHGIPNGPTTVFRTGSVSKQFTAGAIALLALRGDVDLDAPVRRYIPEFPDYADPPTVRHLVHHTSGVRDYIVLMFLAGNRDEDYYTNEEVLAVINRQRELNFAPGAEFLYSNAGYFLLGEIVARVSGTSLRDFAQEHLFAPLGMTHTHFHDDHNEVVANRAIGYAPSDDGFEINVTTLDMVGDGGVFTSVEDWVAWDWNLETGTVGGPQWVALMHQRGVLNSGDTIPYAFGISHGEHRGLATVGHGGSWVGYRAGMSRYPEAGYSFVALCNRSRIGPMALIAATAEVYLEDRMEPAEEATGDATPSPEPEDGSESEAEARIPERNRYTGSYYSPELDVTYHIVEADDAGLSLRAGKWLPVTLLQAEDGVLGDGRGMTFRFSGSGAGAESGAGTESGVGPGPAGGAFQSMMVDAGRVRNLRFTRVGAGDPANR